MGKKNKKDKKGQGKEKTQQKTEKNAAKKSKKDLAEKGEVEIENLIAEFAEQDRKRSQVQEEKCSPPSPRCNMSLVPHPDKDELIMFGGEYFTGNKMHMYNELLVYIIRKNEWMKVAVPNSPPPRSAHQAVALKQGGGQMWIFGGEFASPSQAQFYHYKDLWVYHIRDRKWEKISSPGGPSARSGHRMVQCKKQLIVFGGFHDNTRDYKYYNDVYAFNLETYTWSQISVSGMAPAPRSGCVMAALQDPTRVVIYGGYSKEKVKRDVDAGKMHTNMYMLVPEGKGKDESQPTKWKWVSVKQSGSQPSPRSGLSLATMPGNRAFCFGGVFDEEENDEQIKGRFYNSMYLLELEKGRWFDLQLRGEKIGEKKKRRKMKEASGDGDGGAEDSGDDSEDEDEMDVGEDAIKQLNIDNSSATAEITGELLSPSGSGDISASMSSEEANSAATTSSSEEISPSVSSEGANNATSSSNMDVNGAETMDARNEEESVFKVTMGPASVASTSGISETFRDTADLFVPSCRINTQMAVKNGVLYLYGGIYEDGDRQYTYSDFYSLDLNKVNKWDVIIQNDLKSQVWEESDSSDEDDGKDGARGGRDDSGSDSDEEMDIDFSDAPDKAATEPVMEYFVKTKDYWVGKAQEFSDGESLGLSGRELEKLGKEMCQESFD